MSDQELVLLAHGGGGLLSRELVERIFVPRFANAALAALEDASSIALADADGRLRGQPVLTTDSYVVQPLFFPGGDIGKLAVCGTVNDLAMRGAVPRYLTAGFVLEEGLPIAELERVVASMAAAAAEAGVPIVAGDTKVVERGAADRLFINTAGIGLVPEGVHISVRNARPDQAVLLSGAVGDHGLAILTQRQGLHLDSPLRSDCAPLHTLVANLLAACPQTAVLRDPTRGGLATALNEIAQQSGVGIALDETAIPLHDAVRTAGDLLGLDPLYVANEGKLIALVPGDQAQAALRALRAHPLGAEAAIIGHVQPDARARVVVRTGLGTHRLLPMLAGEQLPRIC
ncbi:MAG: hydrogenase expression/formation protein HypE [Chloroflexi bacterium]|nr:hydrogenase expression/formation protein HypE [Chloroflexota bacterium]